MLKRCELIVAAQFVSADMELLKLAPSLDSVSSLHAKPQNLRLNYGTAGFRDVATVLDSTVFRCGVIAGLRSHQCGKPVGLMITASHNPEQDNGVKMVESNGVCRLSPLAMWSVRK
jgi:hypothetical protein